MDSIEPACAIPDLGPECYARWRASEIGATTERLERRLILELGGDVSGRKVLDVGCGDGELALALAKRGATVTGIDASIAMIDAAECRAKQHDADITFQVATAEQLPFPAGQFDVVTAITILCFVDDAATSSAKLRACCDPEAASSSASSANGAPGRPGVASAPGWARGSGAEAGSARQMNFESWPSRPVWSSGACAGRSTIHAGASPHGS